MKLAAVLLVRYGLELKIENEIWILSLTFVYGLKLGYRGIEIPIWIFVIYTANFVGVCFDSCIIYMNQCKHVNNGQHSWTK